MIRKVFFPLRNIWGKLQSRSKSFRVIRQICENFSYRISDSNSSSQNTSRIMLRAPRLLSQPGKSIRVWQNGTVQSQRHGKCGAPRTVDDRGEQRLQSCVRVKRPATVEQLTTQMNQEATNSVSQTTFQGALLRLAHRSRCLVHAPMMTTVYQQRKLELAQQYSNWASIDRSIDWATGSVIPSITFYVPSDR
ncbi:transposable element Tcb1 transposase [Trichonephila clavipes]|nr:transposable element Tcb1 transposase [Trichonephila clavipes]